MANDLGTRAEWMEYVRRVESAEADGLAAWIANPSDREDQFLRSYFGEAKYQRMRRLARARGTGPQVSRGLFGLFDRPKPTPLRRMGGVVVIPGLMGSALTIHGGNPDPVWLSHWRIALGRLERLRLASDGESSFTPGDEIRPTGALKQYYGELELALARGWEVRTLAYDWRKDIAIAADALADLIRREFRGRTPVHIVAHSMGGLVARVFIRRHPQLWKDIAGDLESTPSATASRHVGRLVMLGTPNHGSHLAVQSLAGLASTVRSLGKLDQRHSIDQIREIIASFPGLLQLLPSPRFDAKSEKLYDATLYKPLGLSISQRNLDTARQLHELLSEAEDSKRMVYVAGSNQLTVSGLKSFQNLALPDSYLTTTRGDGSVSHELGLLRSVVTYFVEEEHSALTSNELVLNALDGLLLEGTTADLSGGQEVVRAGPQRSVKPNRAVQLKQAAELDQLQKATAQRVEELVDQLHLNQTSRALIYGVKDARGEPITRRSMTVDDPQHDSELIRELEDLIIRGPRSQVRVDAIEPSAEAATPSSKNDLGLTIGIAYGKIEDQLHRSTEDAPDAIAVGHYLGVRPSGSERALDIKISKDERRQEHRILNQLSQRGVIRGELGQPFFLQSGKPHSKTIAIAGMGAPGRCGVPELTVVVRELCWTLGRMQCKRLATVLIGAGKGNLTIEEAVGAWLRGIQQAIEGADEQQRLEAITFIEFDPVNALELRRVLKFQGSRESYDSDAPKGFLFADFDQSTTSLMKSDFDVQQQQRWLDLSKIDLNPRNTNDVDPVRLSVTLAKRQGDIPEEKAVYLFSALTKTASVPERVVRIDQRLVDSGNNRLVEVSDLHQQFVYGRYVDELIFPDDLRRHLLPSAPLVIQLDTSTARIHWELLAQPMIGEPPDSTAPLRNPEDWPILGITRGLTRQLKTSFAAPPEVSPSSSKRLRILIVADPAVEHSLPGAEEEGMVLVELFQKFAKERWAASGNEIEVKHFIGPGEATRTNVLTEVLLKRYDILHFAGHCLFDPNNIERSGWLFSNGELLSATEISRIDRVPSLVFSNACESGLTPDGSLETKGNHCPNFAEAFFAQGVSDFICTAWRINDRAALRFAITLYSELLGLQWTGREDRVSGAAKFVPQPPKSMHEAMREARRKLWKDDDGRETWGAYQHYGNPFHRLFATSE